jgi:hypothetical protein
MPSSRCLGPARPDERSSPWCRSRAGRPDRKASASLPADRAVGDGAGLIEIALLVGGAWSRLVSTGLTCCGTRTTGTGNDRSRAGDHAGLPQRQLPHGLGAGPGHRRRPGLRRGPGTVRVPGRGEDRFGGHRLDRPVEPVAAGVGDQHRLVGLVEARRPRRRPVAPRSVRSAATATTRRVRRSRHSGPRPGRGAAAVSTAGAEPAASNPRGCLRGRGPGLGRPPRPRWAPAPRGNSPIRNSRASRSASRRSVLTLSPGGRSSFDGATTTHLIPASSRALASPNPVGPAS